ncbi:MAG: type II secretion system protein GspF [Gammaproteobacteria bacterium]|nr:type II secretion system protein GspF [Gammaproteobacteria bacterium]
MGAYSYIALDQRGRQRKGVIEGDTPRQIRQKLREQGLAATSLIEIAEQEKAGGGSGTRRGGKPANAAELALVTRQLATLVGSGLPLEEALRTVAEQCEKSRLKGMIVAIRSRIMEGLSFATALNEFPRVFSDLYRATVSAGEQSGHLEGVLDRLADYTEEHQETRQRVMLSLIYPVLVLVVAILVVALLLAYVVPQVVSVFSDMGQELPVLTKAMIAASDFIRAQGVLVLASIVALVFAARMLLRRPRIKQAVHRFWLRLPLISGLVKGMNAARFARTLSILSASGVPVLDALHIAAQVVTNLPMRSAVESAARQVREGASLHVSLERSGYFPPLTVQLIASGEASGKLDLMLERAAGSQERELDAMIKTLTGLFGPFMILAMGGMVLLIVLAILLPIFNLNQLLV